NPQTYPNAWRNPLDPLKQPLQGEPAFDPQRGPASPRHKGWNSDGKAMPAEFEWVPLDRSLQWAAFQRLISLLRERGNDVLVIVGPSNEHMTAPQQRQANEKMREPTAQKLPRQQATVIVPPTLPGDLYADASHPLTDGYAMLAKFLFENDAFKNWAK